MKKKKIRDPRLVAAIAKGTEKVVKRNSDWIDRLCKKYSTLVPKLVEEATAKNLTEIWIELERSDFLVDVKTAMEKEFPELEFYRVDDDEQHSNFLVYGW
jgi:hypothetical protein